MIAALVVLGAVAVVCAAFITACVIVGARADRRRPQKRTITVAEFFAGADDEDGDR